MDFDNFETPIDLLERPQHEEELEPSTSQMPHVTHNSSKPHANSAPRVILPVPDLPDGASMVSRSYQSMDSDDTMENSSSSVSDPINLRSSVDNLDEWAKQPRDQRRKVLDATLLQNKLSSRRRRRNHGKNPVAVVRYKARNAVAIQMKIVEKIVLVDRWIVEYCIKTVEETTDAFFSIFMSKPKEYSRDPRALLALCSDVQGHGIPMKSGLFATKTTDEKKLHELVSNILRHNPLAIHSSDSFGNTPLHLACINPHMASNLSLIELLIAMSDLMLDTDEKDQVESTKRLLKTQPALALPTMAKVVRQRNFIGELALHMACKSGMASVEVMKYILQANPASVCTTDAIYGNVPLHSLCMAVSMATNLTSNMKQSISIDAVELLLEKWPDSIAKKNLDGNLPLHMAVQIRSTWDARSGFFSKSILSPQILAAQQSQLEIVKYLIQKCPESMYVRNKKQLTPYQVAVATARNNYVTNRKQFKYHPILELLRESSQEYIKNKRNADVTTPPAKSVPPQSTFDQHRFQSSMVMFSDSENIKVFEQDKSSKAIQEAPELRATRTQLLDTLSSSWPVPQISGQARMKSKTPLTNSSEEWLVSLIEPEDDKADLRSEPCASAMSPSDIWLNQNAVSSKGNQDKCTDFDDRVSSNGGIGLSSQTKKEILENFQKQRSLRLEPMRDAVTKEDLQNANDPTDVFRKKNKMKTKNATSFTPRTESNSTSNGVDDILANIQLHYDNREEKKKTLKIKSLDRSVKRKCRKSRLEPLDRVEV